MNEHAFRVLEYGQIVDLLAQYATSGLGKGLARQIKPLLAADEIERLIGETTQLKTLLEPRRELPIGGLHDLFPLLDKLAAAADVLVPEEIQRIADTLRAGRLVKAYLEGADETFSHLRGWARDLGAYDEIEAQIERTFNPGGGIKNEASPQLKSLRRQIERSRGAIRGKLQSLLRGAGVAPYLQDTSVRERKGRPTIALKVQHAGRVAGVRRDRSDSGGTVFVEPEAVRGLVDELETAQHAEKAEQLRILRQLTAALAAQEPSLRQSVQVLAHIDLTYAKVRLSREFDMSPPTLNKRGIVRLHQARHPLLLALADRWARGEAEEEMGPVVPIDVRLGDEFNTLIITGPNTGGKTVALKTIGLLALMAQSGMHVPAAAGSEVPIFTQVWADIGDEQSIEQSLSTFSSHLRHIGRILEGADGDSLVLLDELGGGTDPAEGAALAQAVLEHLHEGEVRVAVTTHISQLKTLGYTVEGMENASIEFNVETLEPTHRLLIGTPGSSNALAIARRLGLPESVLSRAQGDSGDETAELVQKLQSARAGALHDQEAAAAARAEAESLRAQHQGKLDELARRERQISARAGAAAQVQRVKERLERLQREDLSRKVIRQALRQLSRELELDSQQKPGPKKKPAQSFKTGDEVYVRSLDRVGVLGAVDGKKKQAVVQLGALPMTVEWDDLEVGNSR
ncbi:MAG: endonuclease MutS2 [Candidatus Latescibacteria bacterium]|nr:endonuclease MutS2 [Candidatus Latescibacterota bacterium]